MMSDRPRVFLDTTVLLKAFSATRKQVPLPAFLTDVDAERLTFEKCVYEAYMAFRGVGGKKPDEGRGRWAEQHLKLKEDPSKLSDLANRFHGGDASLAHLWINLIEGAAVDLEGDEQWIYEMVSSEGQPEALTELEARRKLAENTARFWKLCSDFREMLGDYRVKVLAYSEVFSPPASDLLTAKCDPRMLDALFQSVTLPSEDFEIVYAAMRAGAALFVTDDHRLRRSSFSLGLNLSLSPAAFCAGVEYEKKVNAWRRGGLSADFD